MQEMKRATITPATASDAAELDRLLWRVLWQPLGLSRNVRRAFHIEGEELELVAKQDRRIIGGLVAVQSSDAGLELRHLAVAADAQHQGVGRALVSELVHIASVQGYHRIHTIARNTSTSFFRKVGFQIAVGKAPKHQTFIKHGITFELMEMLVQTASADETLRRA